MSLAEFQPALPRILRIPPFAHSSYIAHERMPLVRVSSELRLDATAPKQALKVIDHLGGELRVLTSKHGINGRHPVRVIRQRLAVEYPTRPNALWVLLRVPRCHAATKTETTNRYLALFGVLLRLQCITYCRVNRA